MATVEMKARKLKQKKTKLEKLIESQAHLKDPNAPPFWEMAKDLAAWVPPESWEKLPKDGAKNYKHYLYGHKKRD